MSEMATITVPPHGVGVLTETGVFSWHPVIEGVEVTGRDQDGSIVLRASKDGKEVSFLLTAAQANHLAGLLFPPVPPSAG